MNNNKIIIIGGGGHAKVVISILKTINQYKIIGYTDINNKGNILDIPYLGNDDDFIKDNCNVKNVAIGIGQIKNSQYRKNIIKKFLKKGYIFPAIISLYARVNENVKIGYGTVVVDGVIINVDSNIGKYSIVNTKTSIDHDCDIGNYTHIAPGVTISGNVKIGNESTIGVGSTIIQSKQIGNNVVIGASSLVINNIGDNCIVYGQPCKIIRSTSIS